MGNYFGDCKKEAWIGKSENKNTRTEEQKKERKHFPKLSQSFQSAEEKSKPLKQPRDQNL